MNVFRLVLFLAGLAIYLLVRQSLHPAGAPAVASPLSVPKQSPAQPGPSSTTGHPQTTPHEEVLKPENAFVAGRKR